MTETLFELERAYDRADLAAVFRTFADALEAEEPVELHTPETHLSVDIPARVVAEIEAEHEAGEPPVTELEFELEWDDPDGSSVRVADAPASEAVDEAPDSTADDEQSVADPASATMPTGAVTDDETTADDEATGEGVGRRSRFEVYRDRAEEWRWRLVHWNGNVIADSGEGYASRSNAERAARGVMRNAPTARIDHRDEA